MISQKQKNIKSYYSFGKMNNAIAKRWRLLSGQDNWKGLLDPLDLDLLLYIIHYGERAQANYDTFNRQKVSKYAGSSRYAKRNLFHRVGLEKGNPYKYEVVKYLYATSQISVPQAFILKSSASKPWCKDSNWMGYVAVATEEGKVALGRRDILVSWRGTVEPLEWAKDFEFPLVSAAEIVGKAGGAAHVHKGVLSIYTSKDPHSPYNKTSARDQVLTEVKRQVEKFKDEEISITIAGHSLGAALATLNAADIVTHGINNTKDQLNKNKSCPVTAFGYGSPRVGDLHFRDAFQSMENLHLLRVRNGPDIAPLYPPVGYTDVGEELLVDSRKSYFLKSPGDPKSWHDLEVYLHSVAVTQGNKGQFHLEVKRDIGLVNKRTNALKDEYLKPTTWWCAKNKGMVQQAGGSWMLDDHEKDSDDEGI